MHVANAMMPRPEQLQAFFERAPTEAMVMVNLLKFKDHAEYPDGSDAHLTGSQAYMRYAAAVQECLALVGGKAIFSGDVGSLLIGEADDLWDMVALAYYPSPQAMLDMVALPEYRGIEVHRFAGLAGQLNIRTTPGLMASGD